MKILTPVQKAAVKYLGSRFCGALLMEMRLGKNLTIIEHLHAHNIINVLFVSEYGAMRSMEEELNDYGITCSVLDGSRQKRLDTLRSATEGWVITNYESAKKLGVHKRNWQAVVLDETIKIANPQSARTHYFLRSFKHIKLRFILNGLPSPEGYSQLPTQFLFIHNTFMGCSSFYEYRNRYYSKEIITTKDGKEYPEWTPIGNHKADVYKYVHKHAYVMSRKDAKLGPNKVYIKRMVKLAKKQKDIMKELISTFAYKDTEYINQLGVDIGLSYIAGGLSPSSEHEVISENKYDELVNVINEIEDDKPLIWTRFRDEQTFLSNKLVEANIPHIIINGDVKKKDRDGLKKWFEEYEGLCIALLTIKSGAKGQDWSASNTSIYYSNEWSNDFRSQSEDRLVHLTKSNPVLLVDLLTEGTMDLDVYQALKDKQFDSRTLMSNFLAKHTK